MDKNLTPVMKQYWKSKQAHPDKIVLFQMGDFFEMFYKDAEIAAPLLNIALTARNKKTPQPIPMCGVPLHSVSKVVGTLLLSGYKVAICDQVENSQTQKGLVERKSQQNSQQEWPMILIFLMNLKLIIFVLLIARPVAL